MHPADRPNVGFVYISFAGRPLSKQITGFRDFAAITIAMRRFENDDDDW